MSRLVALIALLTLFNFLAFQQLTFAQSNVVQCGDIVEGEFTSSSQRIKHEINLAPRDVLRVSGTRVGDFLKYDIVVYAPSGTEVARSGFPTSQPSTESKILGERGTYFIEISNVTAFGIYTLFIGCTLGDGTVIEPGDASAEVSDVEFSQFAGFGFPGIAPHDFSAGIEIPITRGQPQTAPLASDVVLYSYTATTGEVVTLHVSGVSGNISIGVTVIRRQTNEIIFVAGMPSSNNLSVELTFPTQGTYAIGLFRLDTAERTNTSGAVQVFIE